MQNGTLTNMTSTIALQAERLSAETTLPKADSIMLASAQEFAAVFWTQDADFAGYEGVRYTKA